jgi:hypothetical protein
VSTAVRGERITATPPNFKLYFLKSEALYLNQIDTAKKAKQYEISQQKETLRSSHCQRVIAE